MINHPLVSVVIPAYNSAATIERAVRSVLTQDYGSIEVIVIDDGSADRTAEIAEAISDNRLRVIRQSNAGPAAARNRGIRETRGEFIAFLDADDEWTPTHLSTCVQSLSPEKVGAAYTFIDHRLQHGKEIYGDRWEQNRLFERVFWPSARMVTSAVVLRRRAIDVIGNFDEALRSREDMDLFIRVAEKFDIVEIPEPLVVKYTHSEQLSILTGTEAAERDYFCVINRAFGRDPARYAPLRATIMAEAGYIWGVTYLGLDQVSRARSYLWRSMRFKFKRRTLWFWARTFVPVWITRRLRQWRASRSHRLEATLKK